jgi:tetratricopeptide (TPR) repeat protein
VSDGSPHASVSDADQLRSRFVAELSKVLVHAERRTERSVDRARLARRLNISKSSPYAYLSGDTTPGTLVLDRLLQILGATDDELHQLSTLRDDWARGKRADRAGKATSAVPDEPARPRQLPIAIHCVGRETELARLDTILDEHPQHTPCIVAIDGTAGVGKTTLATTWAHRVSSRYPDGQLYVDLRGYGPEAPVDSDQILHGLLEAFGVPPRSIPVDPAAKAAVYRTVVADQRLLFFLDNARSAAQIRPLLPTGARCLVVLTTRNKLEGLSVREGAHSLTVDVLSTLASLELLGLRLGTARLAREPGAARDIVELCCRLPLALGIAAARLTRIGLTLEAYAARLRTYRLDALGSNDPDIDLRTSFHASFALLPHDGAHLFRLLGAFSGPDIDVSASAALADASPVETARLLATLVDANLLVELPSGRFTSHDLLREFARHLADQIDESKRQAALERALDYYVTTAIAASRLIRPDRMDELPEPDADADADDAADLSTLPMGSADEGMHWFATELPVLNVMQTHATTHGFDAHTWKLAWACNVFLRRTGRGLERVRMHRRGLAAALRVADPLVCATAKRLSADALARAGNPIEAVGLLTDSLRECEILGSARGVVQAHLSLVRALESCGQMPEALTHARSALALADKVADPLALADSQNASARVLQRLGEHKEAISHGVRALTLYEELGFPEGEADILRTLGLADQHRGEFDQAITRFDSALQLERLLGDSYWEARVLLDLADAHQADGDPVLARGYRRDAQSVFEAMHNPVPLLFPAVSGGRTDPCVIPPDR